MNDLYKVTWNDARANKTHVDVWETLAEVNASIRHILRETDCNKKTGNTFGGIEMVSREDCECKETFWYLKKK